MRLVYTRSLLLNWGQNYTIVSESFDNVLVLLKAWIKGLPQAENSANNYLCTFTKLERQFSKLISLWNIDLFEPMQWQS